MRFSDRSGFSVVELIIVILLLAILAVTAIPRLISTTGITAQMAAEMVASDIKAVQAQAIFICEGPKTITFTGDNSYTAEGLIPPIRYLPGDAIAGSTGGGELSITFNTFGEPTPPVGGGNNQVTVSAGTESLTLEVLNLTGQVTWVTSTS